MIAIRQANEASGAKIIEHGAPVQIARNAWLTGPVPRPNTEKNYGIGLILKHEDGRTEEDYLPEDMSLVIDTQKGFVVLSGCGNSGILNTLDCAGEDQGFQDPCGERWISSFRIERE